MQNGKLIRSLPHLQRGLCAWLAFSHSPPTCQRMRHSACFKPQLDCFLRGKLYGTYQKVNTSMKRLLLIASILTSTATGSLQAQDTAGRKGLSEDDTSARQSVIEKYDANGDGVLDKKEQKKLSKADKKTLAKTGGVGTAGKAPKDSAAEGKQKRDKDEDRNDDKKGDRDEDGDHKDKGYDKDGDHDDDHDKPAKSEKADKGNKGGKGKGGKK